MIDLDDYVCDICSECHELCRCGQGDDEDVVLNDISEVQQ